MIAHGLKAEVAASSSAPIDEPTAWSSTKSVPCVPRRAREGDGVTHIGKAGNVGEGALEPEVPTLPPPQWPAAGEG
jgi:hypothetical protein